MPPSGRVDVLLRWAGLPLPPTGLSVVGGAGSAVVFSRKFFPRSGQYGPVTACDGTVTWARNRYQDGAVIPC